MIMGSISHRSTTEGELGTCINMSKTRLAIRHPDSVKNVKHILTLREKKTTTRSNRNT
jgi:hypothetical protein